MATLNNAPFMLRGTCKPHPGMPIIKAPVSSDIFALLGTDLPNKSTTGASTFTDSIGVTWEIGSGNVGDVTTPGNIGNIEAHRLNTRWTLNPYFNMLTIFQQNEVQAELLYSPGGNRTDPVFLGGPIKINKNGSYFIVNGNSQHPYNANSWYHFLVNSKPAEEKYEAWINGEFYQGTFTPSSSDFVGGPYEFEHKRLAYCLMRIGFTHEPNDLYNAAAKFLADNGESF